MAWLLLASPLAASAPGAPQIIPERAFHSVLVDIPPEAPWTPAPTMAPTATPYRPSVADAKAMALQILGARQYACFDALMTRESRWRVAAQNRRSGAYGIPQALPGSKMAIVGPDWRWNPITQVRWAILYIAGRYGTACAALDHSFGVGWY